MGRHLRGARGQAQVLGTGVAEGDEEAGAGAGGGLDVMDEPRRHEAEIAGLEREADPPAAGLDDRHPRRALEAVGELGRVRVPMRLARRAGLELERGERDAAENRHLLGGDVDADAAVAGDARRARRDGVGVAAHAAIVYTPLRGRVPCPDGGN